MNQQQFHRQSVAAQQYLSPDLNQKAQSNLKGGLNTFPKQDDAYSLKARTTSYGPDPHQAQSQMVASQSQGSNSNQGMVSFKASILDGPIQILLSFSL